MPPEAWGIVGYMLGGFALVLISHRGDIKKVIDQDVEKQLKRQSEHTPSGSRATLALHSTVTSVDLLMQLVTELRRDFEEERAERKREFETLRQDLKTLNNHSTESKS